MPASINDKLHKYKSLFSTTLSTGIGTGTSDTLTPATVTGLPTDTAITLTIDRVDSGGTSLGSQVERIDGVISGGNLTSYVRARDNTTEQAHAGGAVIEMIWNAYDWNNLIDWALVSHTQAGYLSASAVTASMLAASSVTSGRISASAVTSGTIAASAVVSGNLAASSVVATNLSASAVQSGNLAASAVVAGNLAASAVQSGNIAASAIVLGNLAASSVSQGNLNFTPSSGLTSKVITSTRDMTTATGSVAYTGVGFQPTAIVAFGQLGSGSNFYSSIGVVDSNGSSSDNSVQFGTPGGATQTNFLKITTAGSTEQVADFTSFDSDGFTLSWTKVGTPTGTAGLIFLCFK